MSPLLYSFYVNDMEIDLIYSGCQTYELKSLNLFLLVYADDTVLFSENVDDLQKMINSVNEYGLYINLLKTKIVIFRNRGHVKAEEKWFLNGNKIDVCNELMYLGVLFFIILVTLFIHRKCFQIRVEKLFFHYVVKSMKIILTVKHYYYFLTHMYQVF